MYCKFCNAYLDDDAVFCLNCGAPVSSNGGDMPKIIVPEGMGSVPQQMPPQGVSTVPVQAQQGGYGQPPVGREAPVRQTPPIRKEPPMRQAPAKPAAQPKSGSGRPSGSSKKNGKAKIAIIILSAALFVCLVTIGIGLYQYFSDNGNWGKERSRLMSERANLTGDLEVTQSDLDSTNKNLADTKSELETTKKNLETTKTELETANTNINSLNEQVSSLTKEKQELEKQVKSLTEEKDKIQTELDKKSEIEQKLTTLYSNIRGLDSTDKNYYSSKNVLILKTGETKRITVHMAGSDEAPADFGFDTSNSIVSAKWNDWQDNNTSCSLDITAGNSAGTSLITFTNSVDSSSFQVLAVVID